MADMIEEVQEQFTIDDDNKAEWALARIREATEEHDRLTALYDGEKKRLEEFKAQADRRFESSTGYLKGLLSDYMATVPTKRSRTMEKYQLLTGQLVRKFGGIEYKRDDQRLVAWLKDNGKGNLVKVTESPAWADLKKTVTVVDGSVIDTETGAVIDGVTAEQKPDTFDIAFA